MRSEISVEMVFKEFPESPAELTRRIGLEPTEAWTKGEKNKYGKRYKHNSWRLSSGLAKTKDIETHVDSILRLIEKSKQGFLEVCRDYHPTLYCVVYSYGGDRPAIYFRNDVVNELSLFNAYIDVDLYIQ
jgi:hypothetical protein